MKKSASIFMVLIIFTFMVSTTVFANDEIKVFVDNKQVVFDVRPQIIDGRTMVPIRAIFEAMGAKIEWDEKLQRATAYKGHAWVSVYLGNTKLPSFTPSEPDIKITQMDCAPVLIDGRILVPARYVAEAFNYNVEWIAQDNLVKITSKTTIDVSKITYYKNYNDVPDFGSCTGAALVGEISYSYAYYGLSDDYNYDCIEKYKSILKSLNYAETRDNLFKKGSRTVFIHVGNTDVGKMIFIMIDSPNL